MKFASSDGFPFIIAQSQAGAKPDNYWQNELHLEHILIRHEKQIILEIPHDLELMHEIPGGPFGRLDLLGTMTWKLSQFWAGLQTSLEQLPQVEIPPEAFKYSSDNYKQGSQMLVGSLTPSDTLSPASYSQKRYPALVIFRSDNAKMCDTLGVPKHSQLRDLAGALLVMYVLLRTSLGTKGDWATCPAVLA
jgi:hypothetical protein